MQGTAKEIAKAIKKFLLSKSYWTVEYRTIRVRRCNIADHITSTAIVDKKHFETKSQRDNSTPGDEDELA